MNIPFSRAPHIEGASSPRHPSQAPNAALLVDFDNVTMGMRSDLSKELKGLLDSDIIKGKVTVQRAYADWRRYPQYIVPLSEASIDLIFAPAYGSSKKNATDIRMAIDGIELVFTRPEIGTYILLTGDSDFSSLVLKLKEYGKYVIGVGIQESSSDILVQNCDEYYSYTSLSGLRKSDEVGASSSMDPWLLVEKAVERMQKRSDVMRSDRLKQVMLELDSHFDEKGLGFSKFSRFLSEASGKGLLRIRKMENGQYEIMPTRSSKAGGRDERKGSPKAERGRDDGDRSGRSDRARPSESSDAPAASPAQGTSKTAADPAALDGAYGLLRRAIQDLLEDQDSDAVRDSDVKRRMLALERGFDEAELGFSKFSRFLRQAHDHEIVNLRKGEGGNYHVALGARETLTGTSGPAKADKGEAQAREGRGPDTAVRSGKQARGAASSDSPEPRGEAERSSGPREEKPATKEESVAVAGRLHPRRGTGKRAGVSEPPPLFEGQVVKRRGSPAARSGQEAPAVGSPDAQTAGTSEQPDVTDPELLRLPRGRDRVVQYLSNSYRGVGQKTAETLVDAFGEDLFTVLQRNPEKVEAALTPARSEKFMEAWGADLERRRQRHLEGDGASPSETAPAEGAGDRETGEDSGNRPRRHRRTRGGGSGR